MNMSLIVDYKTKFILIYINKNSLFVINMYRDTKRDQSSEKVQNDQENRKQLLKRIM
jgi:hypothetical protein